MPQAVAFVLSGAVAGAGVGAAIAFQAVSLVVLGAISRKLTDRKVPSGSQTLEREVTVRATDAYETFVYGRAMAGGLTVYHSATTTSVQNANNIMAHVVKWAGHRVNCIEFFRLDDRKLDPAVDSIGWDPVTYTGSGLVHTGVFRGYDDNKQQLTSGVPPTRMRWYTGNQTSADAVLTKWFPDWGTGYIGKERAYGVLEVAQVDEQSATDRVFQGGFPTNIQAYVHGKSVYDHRRYALNGDPEMLNVGSWWFVNSATAGSWPVGALSTNSLQQGVGGTTDRCITHVHTGAGGVHGVFSEAVPCNPSSVYAIHWRVRQPSGAATAHLAVAFLDGNQVNIPVGSSDASGAWTIGTYHSISAMANTVWPADWTDDYRLIGIGARTIPSCASFMRVGVLFGASSDALTVQQLQTCRVYFDSDANGSSHLVNVDSTWSYSENVAFCAADYLRNEVFGFGKESRQPINASRYAKNADPCWRRHNTLQSTLYWRTSAASGQGASIAGAASIENVTAAPVGRRALVIVASGGSPAIGSYIASEMLPIDPSGTYTASVHARQSGPKRASIGVEYLAADGSDLGTGATLLFGPAASTWSNYLVTFGAGTSNTIHSSARYAVLYSYVPRSFGANTETVLYMQELMLHVGTTIKRFIEPWEQIVWSSVSSAADWCDGQVSTPSGTQVRFACNGQGHTGRSYRENLRDIIGAGNLRCTYGQSGWLMFGGWQEPSVTLNKADITGPIEVRGAAETRDRYNTVRGTFFDRHQDGKRVPFANVQIAEYRARDGSMELYEDIDLPFTDDWWMAQRVAFGLLEQGDNQMLAKIPVGMRAFGLQVGRHVAVRNDVMSWSPKNFLMTDLTYDLKRGPQMIGREDFSASYVDPTSAEYIPRSFTAAASYVPVVPQVSSVVITPRVEAVHLRWANPANRAFEWIDIYRRTTNAFSGSTLIKSTRNDEYTDPVRAQDGSTYYYWFRTRDFAGNVSSIYPGLTSSFSAAAVFPVARDPEYVFFEEFRYQNLAQFEEMWERVDVPYPAGVSFPGSGEIGGQLLRVDSMHAIYVSRIRIPYDPTALYQMGVKARMTTSHAARQQYFGFQGYDASGTTVVARDGTSSLTVAHWFVRAAHAPSSVDVWEEHVGHVRGHMSAPNSGTVISNVSNDPKLAARMHDNVRYVSPIVALNIMSGTGAQEIDKIWVRKITPQGQIVFDSHLTLEDNWLGGHAYNDTGSFDFINATPLGFGKTELAGEYNYAHLNVPSKSLGNFFWAMYERHRTQYHVYYPSVSSASFNWQARVYVSSTAAGNAQVAPALFLYTKNGSLAARGQANDTISLTGLHGQWVDVRGLITLSNSLVNTTSYEGPYYLSPGMIAGLSDAPGSFALGGLHMDRIG